MLPAQVAGPHDFNAKVGLHLLSTPELCSMLNSRVLNSCDAKLELLGSSGLPAHDFELLIGTSPRFHKLLKQVTSSSTAHRRRRSWAAGWG